MYSYNSYNISSYDRANEDEQEIDYIYSMSKELYDDEHADDEHDFSFDDLEHGA